MPRRAAAPRCLPSRSLAGCALQAAARRDETARSRRCRTCGARRAGRGAGGAAGACRPTAGSPAFNDPQLDALVREAIAYNADLRIAAARVEQAAGVSSRLPARTLYPQVNLARARRRQDERRLERPARRRHCSPTGSSTCGAACAPGARRRRCNTTRPRSTPSTRASRSPRWWPRAGSSPSRRGCRRRIAEEMLRSAERQLGLARDRLRVGKRRRVRRRRSRARTSRRFRDSVRSLDLAYLQALRALEALVGRYPAAALSVAERSSPALPVPCRSGCRRSCSSAGPTSSPPSGASRPRSTASRKRRPRACRASR